jgi:hypothetical protein
MIELTIELLATALADFSYGLLLEEERLLKPTKLTLWRGRCQ